ncbi:MAG: histidine kinase [Bdellovibrio sp.]|nr:histidine kinase [Bdellovibrio sp.]
MNSGDIRQLKPFLSLLFIIFTLLGLVFIKMEERRMSYVVLKSTREYKKNSEIARQKEISLAKSLRPQLMETVAMQRLTMRKIKPGQIINLTAPQAASMTVNKPLAQNKNLNDSVVNP